MKILLSSLVLLAGTISTAPLVADEEVDAGTIRQWVKEGRILPLQELLERHEERLDGALLDLEVEREHGRVVYELEVMGGNGRVREIYIDAATGEWLGEERED